MGTMATARINTSQHMVLFRNFIIQEVYSPAWGEDVWKWSHEDYSRGTEVSGECPTMFECIDAVEAWHEHQEFVS